MTDLFGHEAKREAFKDIRNQRESSAEEKARLCLELNALCKRAPSSVANGSIDLVRSWMATQKQALRILASKSSSKPELDRAIAMMRTYL